MGEIELSGGGTRVYSVSELNKSVNYMLQRDFETVHVDGEISGAKRRGAGHWYLTLKDEQSQLAVVLFQSDAKRLRFDITNGLRVRATGALNVYLPQGRYQLLARQLIPVGAGQLEIAFQQLRARLAAEGLFASERKRPLPRLPRRVALITSPTGAVIRDILATLGKRWPFVQVRVVPVPVQGDSAAPEIAAALRFVNRVQGAEVIIVARGGGSLEDLWAFNEESVARAIFASRIPVVTAIGHETDTTIADLVADVRVSTPTAAAVAVVRDQESARQYLGHAAKRSAQALRRQCDLNRGRMRALLDHYVLRQPRLYLSTLRQGIDSRLERAERGMRSQLERSGLRLESQRSKLGALSPLGVLERGYVYCADAATGDVLTRAAQARPAQELALHFADASLQARVLDPAEQSPRR